MRKLLPFVLFTGLLVPLAGCGGDSDPADEAGDAAEKAAGEVEHGSGAGNKDSEGDGAGAGGGAKHE